jgi:Flp pilus assembly protein TadG
MNGKTPSERNKQHLHRGQSLVEFAIILPILLLVILGAMDFARMFTTKIVLTNAAREGASYLSNHPADFASTTAAITTEAQNLLPLDTLSVGCLPQGDEGCERGGTITITVGKSVDLIFGGFLQTFGVAGGPFELTSTVRMMVR